MALFLNMVYFGIGVEEEIHDKISKFINRGKEENEDNDIADLLKKRITKRKEQLRKLFLDDFSLATKNDIEDLKNYINETIKKDK